MKLFEIEVEFSGLKEFVLTLPKTFDSIGTIIQGNRNILKRVDTPQGAVVIKNFKGMYFLNRLAFSLLRISKATRSYSYAEALRKKEILTPARVAWINCYSWGLLTQSFFICVHYPYQTLRQVLAAHAQDQSFKDHLLHHVAVFSKKLHEAGVYHQDYSLGNILVIPQDNGYQFALVDLNRIQFKKVEYERGLQNFWKFEITPEDLHTLIREYAILSGRSPEQSLEIFQNALKRSSTLRRMRKTLRKYTLTPLEKMFSGKN